MKQLVYAWMMYTGDNAGKLVDPGNKGGNLTPAPDEVYWTWAYLPWSVVDGEAGPTWIPYVVGNYSPTQEEREMGIQLGMLYPYTESVKIYHCLADDSEGGNYRSYSMPDYMGAKDDPFFWSATEYVRYQKENDIPRPGEKYVFLEEADPRGANFGSFICEPYQLKWSDPLTVWHGRSSSFAFADGHCEQKKWSRETAENMYWGYVPTVGGPGEEDLVWMQGGWSMPLFK